MNIMICVYCKKIEMLCLQLLEYSQVINVNTTNEQCHHHPEK